ncbi:hypothetical protein D3C85_1576310 [compost metagenome]
MVASDFGSFSSCSLDRMPKYGAAISVRKLDSGVPSFTDSVYSSTTVATGLSLAVEPVDLFAGFST